MGENLIFASANQHIPVLIMFTPGVSIIDQQVSRPVPGEHCLGIYLSGQQIALMLFSSEYRKILGMSLIESSEPWNPDQNDQVTGLLDYLVSSHAWFSDPAVRMTFLYQSSSFSLVPETLYDPYSKEHLLEPVFQNETSDLMYAERLESYDAYAMYAVPWNLNNQLRTRFADYHILHPDIPWLNQLMLHKRKSHGADSMELMLGGTRLTLTIVRDNKLLYHNEFPYKTWQDVLYYILLAAGQQDLSPGKLNLQMAGWGADDPEGNELLDKYFNSCQPLSFSCLDHIPAGMKKGHCNRLLPLFSLKKCE